jgi:hypothetical protein
MAEVENVAACEADQGFDFVFGEGFATADTVARFGFREIPESVVGEVFGDGRGSIAVDVSGNIRSLDVEVVVWFVYDVEFDTFTLTTS